MPSGPASPSLPRSSPGSCLTSLDLIHDAPPDLPLRLDDLVRRAHSHLNGEGSPLPLAEMENGTQTLLFIQSLSLTRAFADDAVDALPLTDWRLHGQTIGADAGALDQWLGVAMLAAAHAFGDSQAVAHLWDILTSTATPALRWTAALAFVADPPDPVRYLEALAFLTDAAAEPLFRPMLARAVADLAGAEVLTSDRDGVQAAARSVLDRPHASKLPLALALRLRDLSTGVGKE